MLTWATTKRTTYLINWCPSAVLRRYKKNHKETTSRRNTTGSVSSPSCCWSGTAATSRPPCSTSTSPSSPSPSSKIRLNRMLYSDLKIWIEKAQESRGFVIWPDYFPVLSPFQVNALNPLCSYWCYHSFEEIKLSRNAEIYRNKIVKERRDDTKLMSALLTGVNRAFPYSAST